MSLDQQRHDISNSAWEKSSRTQLEKRTHVEENAGDNRPFINGVFWILRTRVLQRDLPPKHGHWENVHCRSCRWRDKGIWESILAALIDDADFEWLMIDVFFSLLEITRVFYHVFIQSCIIIVLGASKTIRFQLKKRARLATFSKSQKTRTRERILRLYILLCARNVLRDHAPRLVVRDHS